MNTFFNIFFNTLVRNIFLAEGDNTILSGIGEVLQAVFSWILNLFTSVTQIFWDSTNSKFTFVGVLLLVGFGLMCVWVVINFIKKLVKRG